MSDPITVLIVDDHSVVRLGLAAYFSTLTISEKTVKSHITNILSKLHLADRTQAAVYAWEAGIVRHASRSP